MVIRVNLRVVRQPFLVNTTRMGCASGKKPSSHCRSLEPASSEAVLHIQVPVSLMISDVLPAGEPAPVSQLLSRELEDRPKPTKAALPPKKTLIQAQSPIQALASVPHKGTKALQTAPETLAICPSSAEPSLASARDITGSKATFDKCKFRQANTSPRASLTAKEAREKPLSSLTLAIRPQAPLLTESGSSVEVRPVHSSLEGTTATQVSESR